MRGIPKNSPAWERCENTVTEVSGQAESVAVRLGLKAGDVVGEIGYDDDVDHELRAAVERIIASDLLDEDADDVLDAVLLWWRQEDGDMTDALVDAITLLADTGVIWLLTPKTGLDGYVEPSDIAEATRTAGLSQTTTVPGGAEWMTARLARAKQGRIRR